ncbi:MAG: hypothetical protein PHP10_05110 [Candidatus Omnitrophica bacterium]|nr:hypothetical protein [Candidatus Omnitrophota bacterium]
MSGAYASYTFDKGYLLDEARLRKVNDIIIKRLREVGLEKKLLLTIFKKDAFYFETGDINDLIQEDNWGSNKIMRLKFNLKEENILFELDFEEQVKLKLEGKSRDFIFLLYSDLKEFIHNEIATVRKISIVKQGKDIGFLLAMLVFTIFTFWTTFGNSSKSIIESTDVINKLNYLITRQDFASGSNRKTLFLLPVALIIAIFVPLLLQKAIDFWSPYNLFLFGKEIDAFEKRQEKKSKIFWGIIVTFIISIIVGLFFYFLPKK